MLSVITYVTNSAWHEAVRSAGEALVYFGLGAALREMAGHLHGRE